MRVNWNISRTQTLKIIAMMLASYHSHTHTSHIHTLAHTHAHNIAQSLTHTHTNIHVHYHAQLHMYIYINLQFMNSCQLIHVPYTDSKIVSTRNQHCGVFTKLATTYTSFVGLLDYSSALFPICEGLNPLYTIRSQSNSRI